MTRTAHPATVLPAQAPAPEPWRARLLVVDDQPERRQALYDAWVARGATVVVETSIQAALDRIDIVAAPVEIRFTLVLVPPTGRGAFGAPGQFIGDLLEEWVVDNNALTYHGRFVCYGTTDELDAFIPAERRSAARTLTVPLEPSPTDIETVSVALHKQITALASRRRSKRH